MACKIYKRDLGDSMVIVDQNKCIGCGLCEADCVGKAIVVEDGKATIKRECIQCGHCVAICPVNAVSIPDYDMDDVEEYSDTNFKLDPTELLHAIKFRRSIRNYKADKVSDQDVEMLVQAGRYTASSKNVQACDFIFVQEELDKLKEHIWGFIDEKAKNEGKELPKEFLQFVAFSRLRKSKGVDFLFRNAPMVLFLTSDWPNDAGLVAQNIENMAVSLGMGALYNGYLARIADDNEELKKWLGIEGKTIKVCMLLGYPNVSYRRTAPRKEANVIIK